MANDINFSLEISDDYDEFKYRGHSCSLDTVKLTSGETVVLYIYTPTIQEGIDKFIEVVKDKGIDINPESIDYQWFNPALEGKNPNDYPEEYQFKYCIGYEYKKHGINHICLDFSPSPLLWPEIEQYFKDNNLEVIGERGDRKIINTETGEIVDNDGP